MITKLLQDQCALDPSRPVLAGISGGPDSLCLLGILHGAGYHVIVAHFDHRLRDESGREAEAVSALAKKMGLPFIKESANVRGFADEQSLSIEEAARILRYQFLFKVANRELAQAVAVGHTADDQVETVLMHFLRGAGLTGLKGMEYRSLLPSFDEHIPIVRPLLSLWRTDTEAYCNEHGLEAHYDPSNNEQLFLRNRLRHTLLPELGKYNPNIKEALLRMATILQDDHAALQKSLTGLWDQVVSGQGEGWLTFEQGKYSLLDPGMRRNIVRRGARILRPGNQELDFDALQRASDFAMTPPGKKVDLQGGLHLFLEEGKIYLATYEADLPFAEWPVMREETAIHGLEFILENGWVLTREEARAENEEWLQAHDGWSAWLDADLTGDHLAIRPRRNGDRFQPLGMTHGSMKLSDFFVNVKLPWRAREYWPLILANAKIAWIPGFRPAHGFRVSRQTKRVMKLTLKRNRAVN
jgi:tRNA(Ile)-lysidine synthase